MASSFAVENRATIEGASAFLSAVLVVFLACVEMASVGGLKGPAGFAGLVAR